MNQHAGETMQTDLGEASGRQSHLDLPERFTLEVRFESDWHVGSGTGRPGEVDRVVVRDRHGLPYVPAKTLTGIWRDGCQRVARALDAGTGISRFGGWVDYLFGTEVPVTAAGDRTGPKDRPRPAALSIRSAHYPRTVLNALSVEKDPGGKRHALRAALTFVKPGVKIASSSGTAEDDCLRFEEMARGGVTLLASCRLAPLPEPGERTVAVALLLAGARAVERLGGNRRRGAGLCRMSVAQAPPAKNWLDVLERLEKPPEPPCAEEGWEEPGLQGVARATGSWTVVPLKLTALSPLLIPAKVVGNVVETLDYVPGTYLLPWASRRLRSLGVDFGQLLETRSIVVTNATIAIDGQRGLPVPQVLAGKKVGGGLRAGRNVYNRLLEKAPAQVRKERNGYIGPTAPPGTLPPFGEPSIRCDMHNVVEDDRQRPTSEVGGVYAYLAIEAGTTMLAELRLRDEVVTRLSSQDPGWWQRLRASEGEYTIGRSRKDDYGLVAVEVESPRAFSREDAGTAPDGQSNGGQDSVSSEELTVWLTSNLLMRDERLRPNAHFERLGDLLSKAFTRQNPGGGKVSLTLKAPQAGLVTSQGQTARVESWHGAWKLPRPSLAGLGAGACAVFEVQGNIRPQELMALEAEGVGERCAEGYGQLCFNHPLLSARTSTWTRERSRSETASSLADIPKEAPESALARHVERAAWRSEIQFRSLQAVSGQGAKSGGSGSGRHPLETLFAFTWTQQDRSSPTLSQLAALRSVLQPVRSRADIAPVLEWLEKGGCERGHDTPNGRSGRARTHRDTRQDKRHASSGGAARWPSEPRRRLIELIKDPERVWQILGLSDNDLLAMTMTQGGVARLKQELWAEAVKTLLDVVIRVHRKRARKGGQA